MSFPLGSQLSLKIIFLIQPPMGGAQCLQVYYVKSPSLDPQPFPPNSISRLAALPEGRRHAEIWKALNNLLVKGTGEEKVWEGGGGGKGGK